MTTQTTGAAELPEALRLEQEFRRQRAAYLHAQSNVALLADILNRRPAANAGLAEAYGPWSAEAYDLMGAMSAVPANDAQVEALSAAQAVVPAGVADCDAVALARYKVAPAHESMFHRFAVVAGDGKQQLYIGREAECQNMARKFAGAFLDGAFYQALAAAPQPSPPPAPAQPGQEGERDYPFLPRSVGDVEDWADGKARGVSWSDAPPPGGTSLYTAGHMRAYVDADRAARAPADSQPIAAQRSYSIDADQQGIRARVADAITGALAFGAQGTNQPPSGHWLAPFWAAAQTDSVLEDAARKPRLKVRLTAFPESNGKQNWTALLVRAEPWDGLVGNCGGLSLACGELWNRVAYAAECARFLIGERDTEPFILDYGDDIKTPDEWKGEVGRAAMAAKKGGQHGDD